jgi:hypothetical protein
LHSGDTLPGMKFLVSGTLRPEKPREEFVAGVRHDPLSHQVWGLVQKGVITEHGFKTGVRPGFILVIECDSGDGAFAAISNAPLVREGWFDIEVDPVSPFASDIR